MEEGLQRDRRYTTDEKTGNAQRGTESPEVSEKVRAYRGDNYEQFSVSIDRVCRQVSLVERVTDLRLYLRALIKIRPITSTLVKVKVM